MAGLSIKVTDIGGGLAAFEGRLKRLASGDWRKPLYERIGARLHELVKQGWTRRAAPSGDPWKPTTRANPILEDSGRMRASTSYEVTSNGITLRVNDFKAAFHQYGTSRGIVPRKMLPEGNMPPEWVAAIQEETDAFFKEWLKG